MSDSSSYAEKVAGKASKPVLPDNPYDVDSDDGWVPVVHKKSSRKTIIFETNESTTLKEQPFQPVPQFNDPSEFPGLTVTAPASDGASSMYSDSDDDDDLCVITAVIPPKVQFAQIVEEKMSRAGFSNRNLASVKPPETVLTHGAETTIQSAWNNTIDSLSDFYFDIDLATKPKAHGLPINSGNCVDLKRAEGLKPKSKARENMFTALRKAARLILAMDRNERNNIRELAKPGGLFSLLLRGDNWQIIMQHYTASNAASSCAQYALHLKNFVTLYFKCHAGDCYRAFPELSAVEMQSLVERITLYFHNKANGGKRDMKHHRHVSQEISAKDAANRLPNLQGYDFVVAEATKFLRNNYKKFIQYEEGDGVLYIKSTEKLCQPAQNVLWAVRVHFMFNSDGQRFNQYQDVLRKEFYLVLLERKQTESGREELKVLDKVCLGEYIPNAKRRAGSFKRLVVANPQKYVYTIRRIPQRVDKKVRAKDNLWHRWNLVDTVHTWYIVHYFLILLPKIIEALQENDRDFDERYPFHHTERLEPMNGRSLLRDMASFFNYHAKKGKFPQVPFSSMANIWRHAFATSEFEKYHKKKGYTWCKGDEECAAEIALLMNSSAKEVLTTYTTRENVREAAGLGDAMDLDDEDVFKLEFSGRKLKAPPKSSGNVVTPMKRKHQEEEEEVSEGEDEEDEDASEYIDEDGDDTRKKRAK